MRKVSLIVLYDKDKKILLQFGQDRRSNKIVWRYFGGGVDEEETFDEALIRETKEELDYNLKTPHLVDNRQIESLNVHYCLYCQEINETEKKNLKLLEGENWDWFTLEDAKELDWGSVGEIKLLMLNKIKEYFENN